MARCLAHAQQYNVAHTLFILFETTTEICNGVPATTTEVK